MVLNNLATPLLCNGIPLNLQKMVQVNQVAVGVDVRIYRSLQLVPEML